MSQWKKSSSGNPWTEADFVPRDEPLPDHKEHWHRLDDEKRDWYIAEIRQRLAAKVTRNEVIGWLVNEGVDPQDITWLMTWAELEGEPPLPGREPPSGLVLGSEVHTETQTRFLLKSTQVHTDPVESARVRADARRERVAATEIIHDAPAPEFRFAQPADANEAWESQHAYDMGNVIKGMILVIVIVVVGLLGLIAMMIW